MYQENFDLKDELLSFDYTERRYAIILHYLY